MGLNQVGMSLAGEGEDLHTQARVSLSRSSRVRAFSDNTSSSNWGEDKPHMRTNAQRHTRHTQAQIHQTNSHAHKYTHAVYLGADGFLDGQFLLPGGDGGLEGGQLIPQFGHGALQNSDGGSAPGGGAILLAWRG